MIAPSVTSRATPGELKLYQALLSIRPAQLGSLAKRILGIRRRVVQAATGCAYWVDPVSVFGLNLLTRGYHELPLTRLVQAILRPGDAFVDVGGNEGYFSMLAAQRVQNGAVICIEPQKRLLPIIRENTRLNRVTSVVICNAALSDTDGEANLFLRPSTNTGASSFIRHWKLGSACQRVAIRRLDDVLAENRIGHVRLMKVDCEGAERLVLAGAQETLRHQTIDFCTVDFHERICGPEDCEAAHSILTGAGYRLGRYEGICVYYRPHVHGDFSVLGVIEHAKSWKT